MGCFDGKRTLHVVQEYEKVSRSRLLSSKHRLFVIESVSNDGYQISLHTVQCKPPLYSFSDPTVVITGETDKVEC